MLLERNIVDEFYLKETKFFTKPKYTTLLLSKFLNSNSAILKKKKTFLDVGCANGTAIYYIKKKIINWNFIGTDIDNRFKKYFPKKNNVNFIFDDIKKKNLKKIKADIVYCSGVMSLFNNPEILLKGLINRTKPKGKIFITSMLNPNPLDVFIKFRNNLINQKKADGEGWNLHSMYQIGKMLKKNKRIKSFKFIKTKFPKKIYVKKKLNEPLRSWTVNYNNENLFINGLCLIQHHYFIIINIK